MNRLRSGFTRSQNRNAFSHYTCAIPLPLDNHTYPLQFLENAAVPYDEPCSFFVFQWVVIRQLLGDPGSYYHAFAR